MDFKGDMPFCAQLCGPLPVKLRAVDSRHVDGGDKHAVDISAQFRKTSGANDAKLVPVVPFPQLEKFVAADFVGQKRGLIRCNRLQGGGRVLNDDRADLAVLIILGVNIPVDRVETADRVAVNPPMLPDLRWSSRIWYPTVPSSLART